MDLILFGIFFQQRASNGSEITSTVHEISHFLDSNQEKIPPHANFYQLTIWSTGLASTPSVPEYKTHM